MGNNRLYNESSAFHYWAYDQTGDPRYYHIATKHADTAIKAFIREDGSARHIVEFDPVTGDINRSYGGQGYAKGSSWTRGQSWALYGFTLSFLHPLISLFFI